MKDKYMISEKYTLDFLNGSIVDNAGRMTGITAYQERFLKYLILNENTPCILSNIKDYVYRGETIPKDTPNFHTQLLQLCPDLGHRISVHKVELMDIGYQLNISKAKPMLSDEMQKILTPAHQMVLQILLKYHDRPLTYRNIIQHSYNLASENHPPLKSVQDIIGICNDFLDVIPGFHELLQPVYVNTVGYSYKSHPNDVQTETETKNSPKSVTSVSPSITKTAAGYPTRELLDNSYIYVGDNTYLNLSHQIALYYENDHTANAISLTPQMVSFLDTLIKKAPLAVSKATLCWKIYEYYDETLAENLYDIRKKLVRKIPALKKCINSKHGFGYSIHLPNDTDVT